ncbi:ubiquitin-related modifier [Tubulinosema ratisbonensis]|uniref:Ubiquitin-related modifier 1 n=1 Tax=Tubulinosema ratisbonensis TaxID=291195 RepID=A0A437AK91_9MICR|nr:ubiquitin-related modifier [Tubulinosema ratisbonensis]
MIINFTSGAEEYFPSKKIILTDSVIKENKLEKIKDVINYLYNQYPKCREKLFNSDLTLCPGMLCCLDDCDWELFGCEESLLNTNSQLLFLSTIHGG